MTKKEYNYVSFIEIETAIFDKKPVKLTVKVGPVWPSDGLEHPPAQETTYTVKLTKEDLPHLAKIFGYEGKLS